MGGVIAQQLAHRLKFAPFDPQDASGGRIPLTVFVVDAAKQEQHDASVKTTDHPVYEGIPVSDNKRPDPDKVNFVAFFTDTAVRIDEALIKLAADSCAELRATVKNYMKGNYIWMVDTSLEVYESMTLESMGTPRSSKWKGAIEMTLHFKQIRKATISSFNSIVKPKVKTSAAQKILGAQAQEQASEALKATATANIVDAIKGAL